MAKGISKIVSGLSLLAIVCVFFASDIFNRNSLPCGYTVWTNTTEIFIETRNKDGIKSKTYSRDEILCFLKSCIDECCMVVILKDGNYDVFNFTEKYTRDEKYDLLQKQFSNSWNSYIVGLGDECVYNKQKSLIKIKKGKLKIVPALEIGFENIREIRKSVDDYELIIVLNDDTEENIVLTFLTPNDRDIVFLDLIILINIFRFCPDTFKENFLNPR